MKAILILTLGALLSVSCARHKSSAAASQPTTQTIAPAKEKPDASTGTDAMTQTVDVDDSRSESDGMASAATPPNAKPAKKAAAKKKGRH